MAVRYRAKSKPKPAEVDRFFGINEAVGQTGVKLGEWVAGFNAFITKDYKIHKRYGHYTFVDLGTDECQGLWYGELDGNEILLFCAGGYLYEYDMTVDTDTILLATLITEGTVTQIGAITDAPTSITWFKDKLYFKNGTDNKEYDGTTYQDVVGYVPTVITGASPSGSGTNFEEINLISGSKWGEYVGDGASNDYYLPETAIDSVDLVYVDDVLKTVTTDYTVNTTTGVVTFVSTPASEAAVKFKWTKASATNMALVTKHKYTAIFGYENDTNMFIFGSEDEPSTFRFCMVGDPTYYPANSYTIVGSTQFAITSMIPQYTNLLCFKEDQSYLINPKVNENFADNTGLNPYHYRHEGLNNKIGNLAPNGAQLINDTPVTFDGYSFRQFTSTRGVHNEIEPIVISDRLKLSLQDVDFRDAVTFDNEYEKELWVNVDDVVYIWNYGNDTMYKHNNIEARQFIDVNGQMYYGSATGIERFSPDYLCDDEEDGTSIPVKLYSGFHDFDSLHLTKNMRYEWFSIKPDTRTSLYVKFVTDRVNEEAAEWELAAEYALFDFDDVDFDDLSFDTNYSPQSDRLKKKVKKFVELRWILYNDTNDESLVILKMLLNAEARGYAK